MDPGSAGLHPFGCDPTATFAPRLMSLLRSETMESDKLGDLVALAITNTFVIHSVIAAAISSIFVIKQLIAFAIALPCMAAAGPQPFLPRWTPRRPARVGEAAGSGRCNPRQNA